MDNEHYTYTSNKGEAVICRNEERLFWWDFWTAGQLVRPAFYTSPEQAAECANKHNFGDEELNKFYVGLRVPSELHLWKHLHGRSSLRESFTR